MSNKYPIVDGHLDMAFTFMMRNLSPFSILSEIRKEHALASVSLPEMFESNVKLFFGTIFVSPHKPDGENVSYETDEEAHKAGLAQIEFYRALAARAKKEEHGFTIAVITNKTELEETLAKPDEIGIVILMEGAEPIRKADELALWVGQGTRIIGPAWHDTKYAGGAGNKDLGFTEQGLELLAEMKKQNVILDLSHLSQKAVDEAFKHFDGPVMATHCNSRSICDVSRNLTDDTLKEVARRGGVVGTVFYDGFICKPLKGRAHLSDLTKHIEHMAKVMGGTKHIAIGSDMDGGFGKTRLPFELQSHWDFGDIVLELEKIGVKDDEIAGIMGGNWLNFLKNAWK